MLLYPYSRPRPHSLMGEIMRDMARMDRQFVPLVNQIQQSSAGSEIVNNAEKFALNLNVSQFKPEELKINLEGRKLTIQGEQENHFAAGRRRFGRRRFESHSRRRSVD
ncbi:unnamed protein product [Caenorhabditis sp. 36 PRJEB53466]|nr:unnamed protein product [Caenorhabditis sp. 36 PRJEB53466]